MTFGFFWAKMGVLAKAKILASRRNFFIGFEFIVCKNEYLFKMFVCVNIKK
jgi:hypothetical protein